MRLGDGFVRIVGDRRTGMTSRPIPSPGKRPIRRHREAIDALSVGQWLERMLGTNSFEPKFVKTIFILSDELDWKWKV